MTPSGEALAPAARPLAILCGGGAFPLEVAADARSNGRAVFLIGFAGVSDAAIEAYPHLWLRLGEIGKLFATLKARAIVDVVIVGAMTRPDLSDLRLDWGAVRRVGEIAQFFRGGDDALLARVASFIEGEGYRVVGAHEVAPRLLAPAGPIGARAPAPDDEADIALGRRVLAAMSPYDIGQGAVIVGGRVIAVEAAEGTDAMLARVAELRAAGRLRLKGRAGVFVKAPKSRQDLRLDMPAVGLRTIEGAAAARLAGVALAAGKVLLIGRQAVALAADAAGLFVAGFSA